MNDRDGSVPRQRDSWRPGKELHMRGRMAAVFVSVLALCVIMWGVLGTDTAPSSSSPSGQKANRVSEGQNGTMLPEGAKKQGSESGQRPSRGALRRSAASTGAPGGKLLVEATSTVVDKSLLARRTGLIGLEHSLVVASADGARFVDADAGTISLVRCYRTHVTWFTKIVTI